jgi:hypothetical protein
MQHTSKKCKTLETYICNIREGKVGSVDSGRQGGGGSLVAKVREGTAEGGEGAAAGWKKQ